MTIELKTGKKGELHISSEDDRLLHCRSFGTGTYVLSGCAVTMTSANKAHIAEGELMVQGGYVRITGGGEDVAISNGVAGQKRNTIIALEYTRDSNGIEAMSFVAVDGTSTTGTPSDPTVTTNNINTGASSSSWKFARIQLDGLTVGTPQILFTIKTAALLDQISSLSSQVTSLQDSVSPTTVNGWTVLKFGSLVMCWITVSGKLSTWGAWGSWYQSNNLAKATYPYTFKSAPKEFISLNNNGLDITLNVTGSNSTTETAQCTAVRPTSAGTFDYHLSFFVIGEV